MSWSVSARFIPPVLDVARIEAACRAVAATRPVELEIRGAEPGTTSITAFFTARAGEVRAWEVRLAYRAADVDEAWHLHGYDGTTDLPIEIEFRAFPDPEAFAIMTFDSGHSGNGACPMIGQDILYALGAELGVECAADF